MSRYTPKQIEKYQRQKYITFLGKISKNLFRLLRQEETTAVQFTTKFDELMQKLGELESIRLDSEYLQETKSYIDRLYFQTKEITDKEFEDIKAAEMSNLNRLQKLKKRTTYKKDKHRHGEREQDWG
jgi:tRNA uridine 5-carbamoylmethylation protein Kti12